MQVAKLFYAKTQLKVASVLLAGAVLMGVTGCGLMMMHGNGVARPVPDEFGLGPRQSAQGRYEATLVPAGPLRTGTLQSMVVKVKDASGMAVDGATIRVDGGMPEHGHGLPTRPQVTNNTGDGIYQIDGVRFNMGGWWELKLAVESSAGNDIVTFNIDL